MKQKRLFTLTFTSLVIAIITSCANGPIQSNSTLSQEGVERRPQNESMDRKENWEKSFRAAMTPSQDEIEKYREPSKEENKAIDQARSENMGKYIRRQIGMFHIAQELVISFDEVLEKLHQRLMVRRQTDPNAELDGADKVALLEARVKLNVAWEFSERNLHELQFVYTRLLELANPAGNDELQRAATFVLNSFQSFIEKSAKDDPWATIALVEELNLINQDILHENNKAKVLDFESYLHKALKFTGSLTPTLREKYYRTSVKLTKFRKQDVIDRFLEEKWQEFFQENIETHRASARDDSQESRSPQSDPNLVVSPGGNGNITGNRFDKGFWAITLDDGPHATHTAGMIKTIQGAGMKATFFWLSQNLTKYPSLVSQAGIAEFNRASHSFTHANLPKLGPVGLKHEIDDAVHVFAKEVGSPPTFFRCPYGACGGNDSPIRTMIANKNMMHVFWNVDSLDWQDQNPQTIFERTKKQIDILGRGIILLHDIHPQSVEAMKLIVPYLKKIKAQVKTMSEMMAIETGKVYPSP